MAQPLIPELVDLPRVPCPPSGRKRVETRYQCGPATPGRLVTDAAAEPLLTWVLNLSTRGVGLMLDQPLEAKSVITLHLKSLTDARTFQLSARIAHCTRQVTGDWILGCELLTPLSDDDLDALL